MIIILLSIINIIINVITIIIIIIITINVLFLCCCCCCSYVVVEQYVVKCRLRHALIDAISPPQASPICITRYEMDDVRVDQCWRRIVIFIQEIDKLKKQWKFFYWDRFWFWLFQFIWALYLIYENIVWKHTNIGPQVWSQLKLVRITKPFGEILQVNIIVWTKGRPWYLRFLATLY